MPRQINSPIFRKLANTATDLGAVLQNDNENIPSDKEVNRFIRKDIIKPIDKALKPNQAINKSAKKTGKKIRKLFGGSHSGYHKLKVGEIKQIIKNRKKDFNRKINITGLTKKDLLALLDELDEPDE